MLMEAHWKGYIAGLDGVLPMANPYGNGNLLASLWRTGWKEGRKIRRELQ